MRLETVIACVEPAYYWLLIPLLGFLQSFPSFNIELRAILIKKKSKLTVWEDVVRLLMFSSSVLESNKGIGLPRRGVSAVPCVDRPAGRQSPARVRVGHRLLNAMGFPLDAALIGPSGVVVFGVGTRDIAVSELSSSTAGAGMLVFPIRICACKRLVCKSLRNELTKPPFCH